MSTNAGAQVCLQDLELAAQRCHQAKDGSQGRGMICQADMFLTQKYGQGPDQAPSQVPVPPALLRDRPAIPDDYHLAREPFEFKYDSDDTEDPEDGDNTAVSSSSASLLGGYDTDQSHQTDTLNCHNKRCNQRKCKEHWDRHPTNAKKEDDQSKGKVVLSLFRDFPKEGTLTYTDWQWEVEEYLRKGYDDNLVKDAMLSLV